jgi:hypothetical protein
VVASVLHGTLEVLAGEVAGADKATVSSVAVLDWSILTTEVLGRIHSSRGGDALNRGLDKRVLGLHVTVALVLDGCVDNGCTAQVVSVVLGCVDKGGSAAQVAAVLHSTLEVLTRKVAGAINTRVEELRSIKRHLSS